MVGNKHRLSAILRIDVRLVVVHRSIVHMHDVLAACGALCTSVHYAISYGVVAPSWRLLSPRMSVASPGARSCVENGGEGEVATPHPYRPSGCPDLACCQWYEEEKRTSPQLIYQFNFSHMVATVFGTRSSPNRDGSIPLFPPSEITSFSRIDIRAVAQMMINCRGSPRQFLPIIIIDA